MNALKKPSGGFSECDCGYNANCPLIQFDFGQLPANGPIFSRARGAECNSALLEIGRPAAMNMQTPVKERIGKLRGEMAQVSEMNAYTRR